MLWGLNSFYLFLTNIYVLFALMIWVGLMGGATYVNVIYLIRESKTLEKREKELTLVMMAIFDDLGIFLASLTALGLTTTVFKS